MTLIKYNCGRTLQLWQVVHNFKGGRGRTFHSRQNLKKSSELPNFHKIRNTPLYLGGSDHCGHCHLQSRKCHSNSSPSPGILEESDNHGKSDILNMELISHLERTSLVEFDDHVALRRLTEAVNFAQQLFEVNTNDVSTMGTVLEDTSLPLREDKSETTSRHEILRNAAFTEEDYFVAPPGNIPLEPEKEHNLNKFTSAMGKHS